MRIHIHTIKNNIHVEVRFTLTRALAEGYVISMFSCAFMFVFVKKFSFHHVPKTKQLHKDKISAI